MAVSCSTVVRVRGLPSNRNINEVTTLLERSLHVGREASGLKIKSLAEDPYQLGKQVATMMFLKEIPSLFTTSTTNKWSINVSCVESDEDQALTFDIHFHGLTALNTPRENEGVVDYVAVCGLGGHAFGSFKERGTPYMWLRDSLPNDMPNLRVLLYGYDSALDGSDSNQNVSVIADSFVSHLSFLRSQSRPISTPLVIIAHSLGGLVVKQAIIKLARGDDSDKKQMESIVGLLFFGVPNRGMDVESLQAIVGDKQNRYLLESVGQYSDLLLEQDGQFGSTFHFRDSHVVSFFETRSSPTAIKVNGSWKMAGPTKVLLVPRSSATRPRLWDSETDDEGLDRTHSGLVKFSVNDVDYERVLRRLKEIASKATATLTSRYLSHESPSDLNVDEEACLRSLSFAEIYARESIIERAVQNSGNWLLESQNFHDWIQRTRLQEHRGFFWIQGNPGSGKSTLMKKIYSHVKASPQDPSSVLAAFFFNARGNELEKSPTGLFRTLLHKLCQRISALRNLVVKTYVEKCRLTNSGWQWQLSELKELLGSVVASSVLGKRRLLLFVDAVDECDHAATQSVIQFFENLTNSSISEGSKFNICLSSRYWPIFRVRNCFIAKVELENKGDISSYIEEHLGIPQVNKEELEVLGLLRTEIQKRAKGTFLWVVLVIRELLNASVAGATLGELRSIVENVPPDLCEFYQHQLQSTKNEDRDRMLRLLQLVFYAKKRLSAKELRYALAFGCKAYSSYEEWSQSSEYVRSDEQMEKRVREHSKGLVEVAQLPGVARSVVQFVHQSVIDFLAADGFTFLRDNKERTHSADGHEFFKNACLNYLSIKDFEAISIVDINVNDVFGSRNEWSQLEVAHPFLRYTVHYLFPHAAQAERHGISQDCFRAHICSDRECFERWRCLHDAILYESPRQGIKARPLHILAQYGLLKKDVVEKEMSIDIVGGAYQSALAAACCNGHQDAVKILLDFGADPSFVTRPQSMYYMDPMSPLDWAFKNQDLPVLRLLLNNQRRVFTLRERLNVLTLISDEKPHSDHLKAVLALLFPEVTFPNTVFDDLRVLACDYSPRVLSFILDKLDDSILHEESLWRTLLSDSSDNDDAMKIVTALLDRGGRVKITGALVKCLRNVISAGQVFSLLLDYCDVEVSEDLLISLCAFENSAQIVRTFWARGVVGDGFLSFNSQQLLLALEFGNAETAAFFLLHQASNTPADETLKSAMRNFLHAKEVTPLLLGHLDPEYIDEQAIITALKHSRHGSDLIRLLQSRRSNLPFSEAALEVAVSQQRPEVVKTILKGLTGVRITEQILTAAATNGRKEAGEMIDLLLHHDPAIRIREPTVIATIGNWYQSRTLLQAFYKHEISLPCTDLIVSQAATVIGGLDALDIILKHEYNARISRSMVMRAMQAEFAAALVAVMLHHDHTIVIDEEHLIAAASSRYDPRTIFAFLQTKGKLGNTNPTSDIINSGPAKRRRISPRSLPRITRKVIDAAFIGNEDDAKLPLLELFLEWGLITQAELDDRHNY